MEEHVDEGEKPKESLVREVKEESGLEVVGQDLLYEEKLDWNWCSKGIDTHYWHLCECEVEGEVNMNERETKSIGWYTFQELQEFYDKEKLEEVWGYWFEKLGVVG